MTITAPAKINLTLDVIQRLPNGYHELKTVFQAIDLCDKLRLTENKTGKINITSNSSQIPLNGNNIVYQVRQISTFNCLDGSIRFNPIFTNHS